MYVCVSVHVSIYARIHNICVHMYAWTFVFICARMYGCVYLYVCMYVCMYVCLYVCVRVCVSNAQIGCSL